MLLDGGMGSKLLSCIALAALVLLGCFSPAARGERLQARHLVAEWSCARAGSSRHAISRVRAAHDVPRRLCADVGRPFGPEAAVNGILRGARDAPLRKRGKVGKGWWCGVAATGGLTLDAERGVRAPIARRRGSLWRVREGGRKGAHRTGERG